MENKISAGIAALLIALGIIAGAFGAHALKDVLSEYQAKIYEKAVFYQLTQALGALVLALSGRTLWPIICILAGAVIFSGTLYLIVFTGQRFWGAVTPVGGTLMIAGWLAAAYYLYRGI
jgi:uncharacterized membrane protein YgdD (TMEM256/DUF423 family)